MNKQYENKNTFTEYVETGAAGGSLTLGTIGGCTSLGIVTYGLAKMVLTYFSNHTESTEALDLALEGLCSFPILTLAGLVGGGIIGGTIGGAYYVGEKTVKTASELYTDISNIKLPEGVKKEQYSLSMFD